MVSAVEALSEVHFVLLVLVIAVRIVKNVVISAGCSWRRTSGRLKSHAHVTSNRARRRYSPIKAMAVLMSCIHANVRGVLSGARCVAQSARIATLAAQANH